MAHVLAARVAESSTTTGTGSFTLAGAITAHRAFSAALATNDTTEYAIIADDGTWEVGVGTLSASTTLARTTVVASSNSGSAVSFASGNKTVLITPLSTTLQGKFEGTGRRITGDFDNGTVGNRLMFQTTTTNGVTDIGVIPNGTGTESYLTLNNNSNPANAGRFQFFVKAAEARIEATKLGTGSYVPINFYTSGLQRLQIATDGTFTVSGDAVFSKAIKENVFTITDGASVDIDPANGTIQLWTLGANRTPTATNFAAGESVTLMILDGTAYSVTWTTIAVTWVGGSAPTLDTTKYTVIELWKVGTTVYGALVGYA